MNINDGPDTGPDGCDSQTGRMRADGRPMEGSRDQKLDESGSGFDGAGSIGRHPGDRRARDIPGIDARRTAIVDVGVSRPACRHLGRPVAMLQRVGVYRGGCRRALGHNLRPCVRRGRAIPAARVAARRLPHPPRDRPGRDGRRLRGAAGLARPSGGPESSALLGRGRPQAATAVSHRSAGGGAASSSAHRADFRRRLRRRVFTTTRCSLSTGYSLSSIIRDLRSGDGHVPAWADAVIAGRAGSERRDQRRPVMPEDEDLEWDLRPGGRRYTGSSESPGSRSHRGPGLLPESRAAGCRGRRLHSSTPTLWVCCTATSSPRIS